MSESRQIRVTSQYQSGGRGGAVWLGGEEDGDGDGVVRVGDGVGGEWVGGVEDGDDAGEDGSLVGGVVDGEEDGCVGEEDGDDDGGGVDPSPGHFVAPFSLMQNDESW